MSAQGASPNSRNHWPQAIEFRQFRRRIGMSLMLLIGGALFLTAVAFDSLHQASAADMSPPVPIASRAQGVFTVKVPSRSVSKAASVASHPDSYLDFNSETAERLRQSDLLAPQLTRPRLTSAHLFTQSLK